MSDQIRKMLGKISGARFGTDVDRPYLLGLSLNFSLGGGGSTIACGGKFMVIRLPFPVQLGSQKMIKRREPYK